MTSHPESPQRYAALHLDEGRENLLGTVTLDAHGAISLAAASAQAGEDAENKLALIARTMNAMDVMHVDAPPPEDAPEFTLASYIIGRDDPDFVPALKDYLRTYYGIELRPE